MLVLLLKGKKIVNLYNADPKRGKRISRPSGMVGITRYLNAPDNTRKRGRRCAKDLQKG